MEKILREITGDKKVKLLFACETGSRAWGFPSPDSDYDVRFIYMHERDWYLSLAERKDTVEHMDGDLDITGWDLKKCLQLLKKSNTPLIERFQSPIVYYEDKHFKTGFQDLIKLYYSPTAVFFHHYSLAQKFWNELQGQKEIKLKSYFYLIRSLLSCNWIIQDNAVLPMDIEGLMTKIDSDRRDELRSLIKLKATVGEKYLHPADTSLNEWIKDLFILLDKLKNNLGVNRRDMRTMDQFFLKTLNTHANN
jgi:uncharacterized protein